MCIAELSTLSGKGPHVSRGTHLGSQSGSVVPANQHNSASVKVTYSSDSDIDTKVRTTMDKALKTPLLL